MASNTDVGRGGGSGADEMVLQDKIVSEVGRCTCENRFLLQKAGDRKYKVSEAHFLRQKQIKQTAASLKNNLWVETNNIKNFMCFF